MKTNFSYCWGLAFEAKLLPVLFLTILLMLFSSVGQAACPPGDGTTNALGYKILYFGASSDFPNPTGNLGSATNPITDWNSSSGGMDAISDCGGNVEMIFLSCYYNTDIEFGDINFTDQLTAASIDNVILDGRGALMENLSAGSAFLRLCERDNWTIKNFTFTGFNSTNGGALGIYASTNILIDNVIFDSNPTTAPLVIDVGDNFTCGFANTSVTVSNCVFSNNPPVSETVSTGAMEINYTSTSTAVTLDVDIIDTDFSCNARQGYGGALAITKTTPGNTLGANVTITGGSFEGNHGDANAGDGGAIYVEGEGTILNIDGTVFSCNDSEGSVGNAGGGAIRIYDGPTTTIDNAVFYGNSVGGLGGYGGAINFGTVGPTGPLTISNTVFVGNTAERGGAMYLEGGTTTTCTNCLFLNNSTTALGAGGAVWVDGASFTVSGTTFSGNSPDDVSGTFTDNGGSSTLSDPGITACPACRTVAPAGCDASASVLSLSCPYFCSSEGVPNTGDADLSINMSDFIPPACTDPLDYSYVFLAVDAAGNIVCEFPATDATTQDPAAGFATIAGPADGIPDAMDPAVSQTSSCNGLSTGDYTLVGFHYLTADAPSPIQTPFVGQTLATIQGYLTNPPTDPVGCGVVGTSAPFTILEPVVINITNTCSPVGTDYLTDIVISGGYPLEAGAGTYTLTTNFGVSTYTFGTPISALSVPAGQSVDVTVIADGNGANGASPACFDCMSTLKSEAEPNCVTCTDPDISTSTVAEICPGDGATSPNSFDLSTIVVIDAATHSSGNASITFHDATPAVVGGANDITALPIVSPTTTTTYYILATSPDDSACTDEIPFIVSVDDMPPAITCPENYTLGVCDLLPGPALDIAALNDSIMQVCSAATFDFGSGAASFAFTPDVNGDIISANGTTSTSTSFDVYDETNGVAGPGGDLNDITLGFAFIQSFDPYGGTVLQDAIHQDFDIEQTNSGLQGGIPMGDVNATDATTGDTRCYTIDVTIAAHLKIEAADFNVEYTSGNTRGEAWESMAIEFYDVAGIPFGSADYAGYWAVPTMGTAGGSANPVVNANPWVRSGTGVYIAQDPNTVVFSGNGICPQEAANIATLADPLCGTTGPADSNIINASTDAGLPATSPIGGFLFTVCLEDVAATVLDGDETTTSTEFTSTLNSLIIDQVCVNNAVCDNGPMAGLTIGTAVDVYTPTPFDATVGGTVDRTYTVTDACGLTATCTQTITIPACGIPCPDIVDGSLAASVAGVAASDVCSGTNIDVCVEVDLTDDPSATVEFSNDGGSVWSVGTLNTGVDPNTFCFTFTESNTTSCDPLTISYQARFVAASLMEATCSQDLQTLDAALSPVSVDVYPNPVDVVNAVVANDGTCGPSLTQACAGYTITNSFDSNGANPDFSNTSIDGSLVFTITNGAAPTLCQTSTVNASYACASCLNPSISTSDGPAICAGVSFDLAGVNVMDAEAGNYPAAAAINTTYHSTSPATTANELAASTVTPSSTTTYYILVTNDNETPGDSSDDCSDEVAVTITVNNLPALQPIPALSVCLDAVPVSLADYNPLQTAGIAGGTYVWYNDLAGAPDLAFGPISTAVASGSYWVVYTEPAPNSCETQTSMDLTVNGLPTISAGSNSPICEGTSLNLTATGGLIWSWSGPDNFSSTLQNPSISTASTAAAGIYTVVATDVNGCSNSVSAAVSIGPLDDASFSIPSTVCDDASSSPAANIIGDAGSFAFNPLPADDASLDITTGAITAPSGGFVIGSSYTLEYSTNGVCSATSMQTITVIDCGSCPLVLSSPQQNETELCDGDSPGFAAATFDPSGSSDVAYLWTAPDGSTSTDAVPSFTLVNDGCTPINVIVSYEITCISESTLIDAGSLPYTVYPSDITPFYTITNGACDGPTVILADGCAANVTVTPQAGSPVFPLNSTASGEVTYDIVYSPSTACVPTSTDTGMYDCDLDAPSISIIKDDNDNGDDTQTVDSGAEAVFEITITNNGNVALTNVLIGDDQANSSDCIRDAAGTAALYAGGASTDFDPGESFSYVCSTNGGVFANFTNTADVSAEPIAGGPSLSDDDSTEVLVQETAGISIDKHAVDQTDTQTVNPGASASFEIVVTNTGDVDLVNVFVDDPQESNCDEFIGTLAAGVSYTYTCTGAALLASYTNTAQVTGDPVNGDPQVSSSDPSDVVVADPSILIVKEDADNSDDLQIVAPNGTATFTIIVTNDGLVDLENVTVSDPLAPNCDLVIGSLAAGESHPPYTCTLDGVGENFTNIAEVIATPVGGGNAISDSDPSDVVISGTAAISIDKHALDLTDSQNINAGSAAAFEIVVQNIGDIALTNVFVDDPMESACNQLIGSLGVGEVYSYTCTGAAVDAGYTNIAIVTGDPTDGSLTVTDSDPSEVVVDQPSILIVKDDSDNSDDTQIVDFGGTASFTITVTNTGNVDLENVTVTDPLAPNCDLVIGFLAAGASHPSYTCTVDNVAADFTNIASVIGDPTGGGESVSDEDASDVLVDLPAAISIDKRALDQSDSQTINVGTAPAFEIVVTNIGQLPLSNVLVVDPLEPACDQAIGDLASGEQFVYTCSGSNVSSSFTNIAEVTGDPSDGSASVTDSDSSDVLVNGPEISIDKDDADNNDDAQSIDAGASATFTITVSNTGNVDLENVVVSDPSAPDCDLIIGFLAAGESYPPYTCSIAGVSASFTNTASVSGSPVGGGPDVTDSDDSFVEVIGTAEISIDKSAVDGTDVQTINPGQNAVFEIVVSNTGDVDLENVFVTDFLAQQCDRAIGDLAAGEIVVYTCIDVDVDYGYLNTAQVVGDPVTGAPSVFDEDVSDVLVPIPAIQIDKNDADNGDDVQVINPGGTANFSITVTNTGEIDLENVTVSDPLSPGCNLYIGYLEVGESFSSYTCSVDNVESSFTNVAVVTGNPSGGGDAVFDEDPTDVVVVGSAAVTVQKNALNGADYQTINPGASVSFEITVVNSGDVDLEDVVVSDPMAPSCDQEIGFLAVGESFSYTCEDTEVTEGYVNIVEVTADPVNGGQTVADEDPSTVDLTNPSLVIIKEDADNTDDLQTIGPGGSATFSITVVNNGNVDLEDVVVSDAATPACDQYIGFLAVGEVYSYTCTIDNVVQSFINIATVTAIPTGGGATVADDDPSEVLVVGTSSMLVSKQATDGSDLQIINPGQDASFEISITNTGDVDLENIVVNDAQLPACDNEIAYLAVGETLTFTCVDPNVQDSYTNLISVVADPVNGDPSIIATDDSEVAVSNPSVLLIKDDADNGDDMQTVEIGGSATFTITVVNKGNVDLENIIVGDNASPECQNTIDYLAVGESTAYTCTVENVSSSFINLATVAADPVGGGDSVFDNDDSNVQVAGTPGIDISKTAFDGSDSQIVAQGEEAIFSFVISNTGDVDLTNVVVEDPQLSECDMVIGDLAVGEQFSYLCSDAEVEGTYTNVATVTALPMDGSPIINGTDDTFVEVLDCAGFVSTVEESCIDDNDQFYTLVVAFNGGDPGPNGYTVLDNNSGAITTGITGSINFGTYASGSGYNVTVSVSDNPQCAYDFSSSIFECEGFLAVEFLGLVGLVTEGGNQLNWSTAMEFENSEFLVMRSQDGIEFELLSRVEGAGYSNSVSDYHYFDENAPGGLSYYKILSRSLDGLIQESNLVSLSRATSSEFAVFPIPVENDLMVNYNSVADQIVHISIKDLTGRIVQDKEISVNIGNSISRLHVSQLPPGIYLISLNDGVAMQSLKFVKQ